MVVTIVKIDLATIKANIYKATVNKEMPAVNCNSNKIIQAIGTAINVSKPVPKTFKVFFPTNLFVSFKNLGANHKHTNQMIITNARKAPKSEI